MINLSNAKEVKALQASLRAVPIWHKDNMEFLEQICGWYDFNEKDPTQILISHGKRQVLATLKTLFELTPEQVANIADSANDL